ncbi:AtuA-related protein [Sphingomonas paeninsulae]|uniref:AtuA-related protein n=1 Tax=Sphingomonas paeninsulae TaxID=2319844 RepID=UPI003D32D506
MRVFSCLIDRNEVPVTVTLDTTETIATPAPPKCFDPSVTVRPAPGDSAEGQQPRTVPLIELAWARSGDKGDAFNIGVIARRPEYLPYIRAALTEAAMRAFFAHEFEGARNPAVLRYEVPGLNAINLHFLDALGGGQFASLRLDPLAKGKAQQLLDFEVPVPAIL